MFERASEEYVQEIETDDCVIILNRKERKMDFQNGAVFGYDSAIKWFDAKRSIPLSKQLGIYRYTIEVISDKGDIVCYDYKDKCWKKIVIEDEKVTYVPVEIEMWCNKPTRGIE